MEYQGFKLPKNLTKEIILNEMKVEGTACPRSLSCVGINCVDCILWLHHMSTSMDNRSEKRWKAAKDLLNEKTLIMVQL